MRIFDDFNSNGHDEELDIATLSNDAKLRLNALKNLDIQHSQLHIEFLKELSLLERKYQTQYQPLYNKRAEIVNGAYEPTEEETKVPDFVHDYTQLVPQQGQTQVEGPVVGIPNFWLTCLLFHPHIGSQITDADKPVLSHLRDIQVHHLDTNPGFALEFQFSENEWFSNASITKTYYLSELDGMDSEYMFDRTESTVIEWKEGKDLTVRVEMRKQRHKELNKTRVVKRSVPAESFFNFFKSRSVPNGADIADDDEADQLEAELEFDYQIGEELKEKIIPQALSFYTGEADIGIGEEDDEDEDEDDMDQDSASDDE